MGTIVARRVGVTADDDCYSYGGADDDASLSDEGSLEGDASALTTSALGSGSKKNVNKGRWTKEEDEVSLAVTSSRNK